ncbi:protein of unknown function [Ruminococcaceae bacterium BL-6]|nr:protein of unknown function [Ruminococcaceae bacterium BL-6]
MAIQNTINELRMGVSALTETIMVGIPNKDNTGFKYKTDLKSDFLKCVIEYFGDINMKVDDAFGREINGGDKTYYITIKRTR